MWDEIDGETGGLKEEEEKLKSRLGYWWSMLSRKSMTNRFTGTRESAVRLIESFIDTANKKSSLLLQQEMVDFRNNCLLEPDSFRKRIRNFSSNSLKRLSRGYETLWLRIRSMAACDNRYQALNEEYDAVGHWNSRSNFNFCHTTKYWHVTQCHKVHR